MKALVAGVFVTALCLLAQGQDNQSKEIRGLHPRAAPTDYQSQGKAGDLTIAADFPGHFVPTPQGNLTTEDYVVVEAGIFGPADAHIKLFPDSFSLRINGKKAALPGQPYGMIFKSLKDPDWEPPEVAAPAGSKSKTSINAGGGGGGKDDSPPPPVHIPIEVQRAMQQRVQKASLPEGDRTVPLAGLLFFQYSGKTEGIRSIELIYKSPAGSVTLALRP